MATIPGPITLEVDHPQRRVTRDRLYVLAQGSEPSARGERVTGWDLPRSSGVWQDPITWTVILAPLPIKDTWAGLPAGASSGKLQISDLDFSAATGWKDMTVAGGAVGWLHKANAADAGETLTTKTALAVNEGMYLAWHTHAGADDFWQVECGWGATAGTRAVSLRFYVSGRVELWKAEQLVAEGTISGAAGAAGVQNQILGVMLIPARLRELLVVSTAGGGFAHVFEDLAGDGTVQTITPATKFWVRVRGTVTIQIARLRYESSGHVVSPPLFFADPPPGSVGAPTSEVFWSPSGTGTPGVTTSLRDAADPSITFSPDGVKASARIRVNLTGGPATTPFLYAASMGFPGSTAVTANSPTAVPWGTLSLTVPDRPSGERWQFSVYNPAALVAGLDTRPERPARVTAGDSWLVDGRLRAVRLTRGIGAPDTQLSAELLSEWDQLAQYRFQERFPLDGLTWVDALELILTAAGVDAGTALITDPGITLPLTAGKAAGEWSLYIEEGDTAADWIERLHEAFTPDWFFGFVPQASGRKVFRSRPPYALASLASAMRFWRLNTDAIAGMQAEGYTLAEATALHHQRTILSWSEQRIPPEATDVRVTGYDPATNRVLQAKYVDSAAEAPGTAVASRPANWVGEKRRFGYVEPMLTSQALVDSAADRLGRRLTPARTMVDVRAGMAFWPDGRPLWQGDAIRVDDEYYVVLSFSTQFGIDDLDAGLRSRFHPTGYLIERVGDGTPWPVRSGALDVASYLQFARERAGLYARRPAVRSDLRGARR